MPVKRTSVVTDVNRTLRGWYGHFQHSKANVFLEVDGHVRRRLRRLVLLLQLRRHGQTQLAQAAQTGRADDCRAAGSGGFRLPTEIAEMIKRVSRHADAQLRRHASRCGERCHREQRNRQ